MSSTKKESSHESVIFIQSKNGEKVFELNLKSAKFSKLLANMFWDANSNIIKSIVTSLDNPFKISEASDGNMNIIMDYLCKCGADGKEEDSPDKPLPRDTIPNIFKGNDYAIFRDILESKESDTIKMNRISTLITDISYFDMVKFREKAAAAMASLFVGKPIEEIRSMVELDNN